MLILLQLKDTADRIRAVDQAAALVEEMLKQGRQTSGVRYGTCSFLFTCIPFLSKIRFFQQASSLTTVVFVDFEAGSHLDLVNRIRGPNVSLTFVKLIHTCEEECSKTWLDFPNLHEDCCL